jgi:cytidylate kinase
LAQNSGVAVITFSREPYSGTQDLARLLAQRLGYRYIGLEEMAQAVTARGGVARVPQSSEHEGRALSLWELIGEHLTGDRETYIAALKAVVTDLAVADNVVMVGHGAGLLLGDMPSVVRVFVVAPMNDRVTRFLAQGEGGQDADQARRTIEQRDRESADFLRRVFGIDWLDAHHWDLVINTGRANAAAALDMLTSYAESVVRNRSEHDSLGKLQLASRIERELLARDDLGVDRLRVRFDSNTLVLEGAALARDDRDRAEAIARSLAPMAVVDNQIVLRPPTTA